MASSTSTYNSMEMFFRQLRGGGDDGENTRTDDSNQSNKKNKTQDEEDILIDPKIKQFYEVKGKLEPFYSGGKISIISPCQFLCQSASGVNLIIVPSSARIKKDENVNQDHEETTNEEAPDVTLDDDEPKSFSISAHFNCEDDEVLSFDACPVTFTLITAHKSGLLRKWNLHSKQVTQTIKSFHYSPIGQVEIDHTASIIKYADFRKDELVSVADSHEMGRCNLTWATVAGNTVKFWNDGGNTVSKDIKIEDVTAFGYVKWDYSTNAKKNEFLLADRRIYVIGYVEADKTYSLLQSMDGHYSQVTGVEWTGNGTMISAGRDRVFIIWNRDEDGHYKYVKAIAFSGLIESMCMLGGKDLYFLENTNFTTFAVKYFDTATNKICATNVLEWPGDQALASMYSPIRHKDQLEEIYMVSSIGIIYRVGRREKPGKLKKKSANTYEVQLEIKQQYVGSLDEVLSVAIWKSAKESKIAVANNTSVIKLYDMGFANCQFLRGHKDIVLSLFARNEWLVSGSKDNTVICWNYESLEPKHILSGHLETVTFVCMHPTELNLYSVSEDNYLRAWTMTKCIKTIKAHEKEIHVVDASPNGEMLVTGSRDKTAKVWETDSFQCLGVLKGHKKGVWDAKFSHWDQLIVTASADTTLKVWDCSTMTCLKTLQGHQSAVLHCVFVNLGLQVLSSSSDGTWKAWDLRSNICVSTSECSEGRVWALDSSSDGSLVVTGTEDSILTLWVDVTQARADEKNAKRRKTIEDEQNLSNLMRRSEWEKAIRLAIELDRPHTLIKIVRGITTLGELQTIIGSLSEDHKLKLSNYIQFWNTNSKTSTEAQLLLHIIISTSSASSVNSLPVPNLLSYTDKHYQRLKKYEQSLALLDIYSHSTESQVG